ncbi:hypothetical protein MTBBW1_1030019 [Desulfamplus magnetovallimortis]|uniref:histidine kinase n=1 Tax=Desulfamplus magnetovallimortis TaxID=1246637 RepID=A0A1W1H4X2_9BACT|nr:response regulator [Desulfamplus magnetovallimortis]SLM27530.1 hypothetical protein MTBBW1_1030019 [Desulfamplus magnetovallimortis]
MVEYCPKVLTVDDEAFIRRSIRLFLEDYGFTVFEAANGKEGLKVFNEVQPDIVLLDLKMPELDGYQLLDLFYETAPEIPVIVASGTGNFSSVVKALHSGACDYILKPIQDMNVLRHAIQKCLKESDLKKKNQQYQKDLERQLRRAQKMEAIAALTGGIAHDLNNILSPILGYAGMLMNSSLPGDMVYQRSQKIQKAGYRAADLVNQILNLSRKDEGEIRPLQLRYVVREVVRLLKGSIPSTITIRESLDKRCGRVKADSTQIHQVLMNLCTNAYHAMESIGGILTISLKEVLVTNDQDSLLPQNKESEFSGIIMPDNVPSKTLQNNSSWPNSPLTTDHDNNDCCFQGKYKQIEPSSDGPPCCCSVWEDMYDPSSSGRIPDNLLQSGRYALVQVTDTGKGIPDDIRQKIFDPYFTTKDEGRGTGLGLSIARNIVRHLDGEIHFESSPEEGTCFSVLIPILNEGVRYDEEANKKLQTRRSGSQNILVVDDDTAIVQMYKEGLEESGYVVKSFDSSMKAALYIKEPEKISGVDLAVFDQTMPDFTGIQLAEELFSFRPGIPVILCSGYPMDNLSELQRSVPGIKSLMKKPFTVECLSIEIQKVLHEAGKQNNG